MRKFYFLLLTVLFAATSHAQTISATTYPFASSSGAILEDMSSGTTTLVGTNVDDVSSNVNNIGFDFWYVGVRYTQFSASSNGLVRLGGTAVSTGFTNAIANLLSGNIMPYWDDLWTGTNGKVHYKVVGAAPNRKLVIEWLNEQVPRVGTGVTGAATFQLWLYETTGAIEIVYGNGMALNTVNSGASIGIANSTTIWAHVTTTSSTVSYVTENNANTAAITSGTKYTFTPLVPLAPSGLSFTGVTTTGMTLNWTDNATNEIGYVIYRSDDGGATYNFVKQIAAGSTSDVETGLGSSFTYFWKVYAVTEGGLSTALTGSQATLAGTICGALTVGPTGTYPSLTAAITAIQTNGLSCATILELQSTYLSTVETFPVNFTNLPTSPTNTLTVRPQAGAVALSITSASATGTILIDNGDYITIDGRAGGAGSSQLTISNTATAGYTIQFINSATNNTVKYCTVAGVNTSTTSGVIVFSTAVGLTNGNSFNTINNCDIKDGATTPTNLIYATGTTTTYSTQNNNNTISNNTLHDWFNASSTTSGAAINIVSGASDWTINANSFYQTASRIFTMTSATDQGMIFIASTTFGYNFTISNNFIGGTAPNCGGGPLTWSGTGTTGTPTPRLVRISTSTGAFNNITGNTIANLAFTSASGSTAYGLISVLNGNTNISSNTLGSQSVTGNITCVMSGTSTAAVFLPIGVGSGSTVSVYNITNNNIGGITLSTTSTGVFGFRVIFSSAPAGSMTTISNNFIGGTVANSIQQLTGSNTAQAGNLNGVMILTATVGNIVSNNTIRNLTVNTPTFSGPYVAGINVQASGGGHDISGNTIFNLTNNNTNTNINNIASVVGLTSTGSVVGGLNVSGNTIHSLTNTNTTVAGWINGMYFSTAGTTQPNSIISKNFVHSINLSSSVAGAGMVGIFFPNTGRAMMYNNMVRLGVDASGASITNPLQINGIWKPSTGNLGCYFNTIYIGGTGVASGTVNSFAFQRTSSGTADSILNNIFWNARSNASGTGKHYAIGLNANTAVTSNNNDLLANGTGGVLGVNGVIDYATLPAWQSGTTLDGASFSFNPQLLTPGGTSATVDLHINPANPTPIEQAGVLLSHVTDDFDAQSRAGLTPVDVGADAGNFTPLDISSPVITYTALTSACVPGDRTLTGVTITDVTGVPTSGGLRPRIYYRKNANPYVSQPGTLTSGTGTNGTWSFPILAADMGGLVQGDVVSYYIIAQDLSTPPNIGSNPAGVVATDVNTVTTHPATPNSYMISSLNGTYTVGAGGNYTTLTAAVFAYNNSCLLGPVTFNLIDATYPSETFPITINANPDASAVNTLTIKPTATTSITGSSATGILVLNGADYITIDGSNNGTSSRNLTISNTATAAPTVISIASLGLGLGATNNTIKNININTGVATSIGYGISIGGSTPGTAGADNDNNTIQNNNITAAPVGIYANGTASVSTGGDDNLMIVGNTIDYNNTTTGLASLGIQVGNSLTSSVNQNTVSQQTSSSQAPTGISLETGFVSSTVNANTITAALTTNTGGYGGRGITVGTGTATSNLTISNNMISGVNGTNWSGFSNSSAMGIAIGMIGNSSTITTIAGGINLYFNTVNMTGSMGTASTTAITTALYVGSGASALNVRNNILVNTQVATSTTQKNYAVYSAAAASAFTTINYNDYYVANSFNPGSAFIGFLTSDRATLANWQTATSQDANSINVLPVFISSTNLHLSTAAGVNWCLNGSGVVIAGITTDIDGNTRSSGVAPNGPDMGADEFVPTGFVVNNPAPVCSPATVDLTAAAVTAGSMGGLTYTYFTDAAATVPLGTPNAVAVSGTYYIKATNGTCSMILPVVVVVSTPPSATISYAGSPYCADAGNAAVTQTGTPGGTYSSTAGLSINPATGEVTLGTSTPGTYTVTYTIAASGGCPVYTTTAPITITAAPAATISYPGSPYCTYGISAPVTQTGTTGGTYSSTAGLTINPATGEVNPSTSTPATYTVTYTIAASGGCPVFTTTASITINVCAVTCIENFDGVVAPVLPSGWTASTAIVNGASLPWATVTTSSSSAPNSAFSNDPNNISDERLDSRIYTISSNPSQLVFRNQYNLESTFDGMVLEISINGGPFTDIITAGGSFVTGGYNSTISVNFSSPIAGRQAWSGSSGGFITTTVTLPPAALGQPVVFRWRRATDNSVSAVGVNIDDVYVIGTATIAYTGSPYCPVGTASVTRTGTSGGTYSSTAGLVINASTGDVNLVTSTPGTYTVTYTIQEAPGCPTFTATAPLTINPAPNAVATPPSQTVCSGTPITTIVLSSAVGGTTYAWTRDNTVAVTGIAGSGSGDISGSLTNTTSAPVTVTFTITPTANGCTGPTSTATVLVNPTPNAVATPASQTRCSGVAITTIVMSGAVSGTTYAWTRDNIAAVTGIAASGSGNISGTLTNTTTAPVTVTFTITPTANSCPGAPITATVLVNPTPNAVATPASQTVCSGAPITTIVLTGNVSGTTYTWTRNNTVNLTGIPASGTGNISGTFTNTTNTVQTTTFTITPSANGCNGPAITATVTVNPNPTVNAVANRTVCNGSTVAGINFTSPVSGVTFNWTNSNTAIGLGASGTGNLPSFTATNTTTGPLTGTITVTATYTNVVSCVGTPMTFTITVAPTPTVDPVPNQTVCAGSLTAPVNFTSPVAGTTYSWTNNTTSIGLAASGNGNIAAFTAINATTNPVTATVTVTPNYVIGSSGSITLPPQSATFTGNVRGYWFTAPTSFTMTSLFVPTDASTGNQSIAVVRFTGATPPPVFPGTTNAFTTLFVTQNDPTVGSIPVSIPIATGDVIGIMGYRATINSYSAGPNNITIAGFPASLTRMGMQFPLTTTLPQNIWQEPSVSSISRVLFDYTTGVSCTGTPRSFTITVNPIPTITCPANMTVPTVVGTCTAPVNYTPTITGTPAPTLSYSFSGATTGTGSGSGSGSLFNIGVTTVTVTATNSCGTVSCSFTITVTDSQTPIITTQPVNQSVCAGSNATFSVVSTFASVYQWQFFNGTGWVNITGANASSYTVNNVTLAMNTNSYRVLVTGPCGTVTTSTHATLTVNPIPTVVLVSSIPPILLPTQTLTLTAQTLPPPQAGGTFVWRKNGNIIVGATGSTLGPLTVNDVGSYTVTYTVNGCSATSNIVVVSAKQSDNFYVYPNPNFGQFQVRFFNQVNEAVTVTVYDSKGSQVYQRRVTTTTPYTSIEINLGNNPQGSYLVELRNSSNQVVGSKWVVVYH